LRPGRGKARPYNRNGIPYRIELRGLGSLAAGESRGRLRLEDLGRLRILGWLLRDDALRQGLACDQQFHFARIQNFTNEQRPGYPQKRLSVLGEDV
jgi:hypothetical protein